MYFYSGRSATRMPTSTRLRRSQTMSITPSTHVWPSLAAAAILIMASMSGASSEGARTVKLVVPVPPGGAGDILARQLGEQIAHAQGASRVAENPGGPSRLHRTD